MKAKGLFSILILVGLIRAWWVFTSEVSPQDAYYWMCSQRLSGAFFDGPAGTALLLRAFGDDLAAARLFWVVMGFLASWAAWLFLRRIADERIAAWAVILLNAIPVFHFSSIEVGPLMPALLLSLAGLVLGRVAWEGRRTAWLGAGLLFAAAVSFRYEAILIPLGLLGAAAVSRRHRSDGPWLVGILLLCAATLWPAMEWNASLEWIPVAGGTLRSAWEFHPMRILGGVERLALDFSPPVLLLIAGGLVLLLRRAQMHARAAFLVAVSVPLWVLCALFVYSGSAPLSAAWLGFVPVAGFATASMIGSRAGRWAISLCILLAVAFSWVGMRRHGWEAVAREVLLAARDLPAAEQAGFFIADEPGLAAVLGYHMPHSPGPPSVFVPESPALVNQFGIWASYADFVDSPVVSNEYFTEQKGVNPYVGRNAVYLGSELPQTISAAFSEVVPLKTIAAPDGRSLGIYLCIGYETLPL